MELELASAAPETNQDAKNIALLVWLGTIPFGFIPSLIVYLTQKDQPYVQAQAKEALNWSITAMIGYVISFVLIFVFIGALLMVALGLAHLVFCIMGAVAASGGKAFKAPFTLRLIK